MRRREDAASGGERPFRARREDGDRPQRPRPEGDRPFKPRRDEGGERPFRARREDGDRPQRPRPEGDRPFKPRRDEGGERPFRARREDGDRPQRPRPEGDRPFKPRRDEGGERPFRARREDGDRPQRSRPEGDRPFKPRRDEGGERPFRARREDGDRPQRPRPEGDRPFKPRRDEGGERPFRARREDGDRPQRPRPEGDRPFKPRRDEGGERPFRARREDGDRPQRPRPEGDRPFRPRRDEGGERPFRARSEDRQRSYSREAPPRFGRSAPKKETGERIAKVIARAGLCSRRDAEAWIEAGRVQVNGEVLTSPALDVSKRDNIMVDGKLLPSRERTRLFLFHKPRGLVTTARDPEGRATVFESLPKGLPRVVTIGRLDINTEGLLLLTNDGGLARMLELPETGWLRRYRVRAHGSVTQDALDALAGGVTVDGMDYGPVEASLDREQGDNVWITLGLREGKNREVKRILEHLGLQVNRLIRLSFGPFQLGDLGEGAVEEVRTRVLADQLGDELAREAGVDFEAPVFVYEEDGEEDAPVRHRRDDDERPARARAPRVLDDAGDDRPAPRRRTRDENAQEERPARPPRRHPTQPLRSVWRDESDAGDEPRPRKVPRRGADPKEARAEAAERPRERAGTVQDRKGRSVTVEKLARVPAEEVRETEPAKPSRTERRAAFAEKFIRGADGERPSRGDDRGSAKRGFRGRDSGERSARGAPAEGPARAERPKRNLWSADADARPAREGFKPRADRPAREGGDRPFRPRGEAGDKPFRPRRDDGDRPFRSRSDEGPRPARRPEGERPFRSGDKPFGKGPGRGGPGRGFGGKPPGRPPAGGSRGPGKPPGRGPGGGRPRRDG